jgi:DNA-3-methyladenine glycosylase II
MTTMAIKPQGPFSLAASGRFLEGFAPARYHGHAGDGAIRLAFPADDGHTTVGAAVRQAADGTVLADLTGDAEPAGARAQLARIFSLDTDGSGFDRVADADPVVAGLAAQYPGLRPVCFGSPYEAAAWAVIGHRIRITQAAAIKERVAAQYGQHLTVAGAPLPAFPAPRVLRDLAGIPGLTEVKTERLRTLPGIGPFSAELILIRGAGHPDLFPAYERRLHAAMADAYRLDNPSPGQLTELSARWAPYRSWVALLLRTQREETTGEITRGPAARPA